MGQMTNNQMVEARRWLISGLGYSEQEAADFHPETVVAKVWRNFPGGIVGFRTRYIV